MIYSVRHVTRFRYKPAVRESIMEVRMQPRTEGNQRCLSFDLKVKPEELVMKYRDFLGNLVHHFDIAGKHAELNLKAQSVVEIVPAAEPDPNDLGGWDELDAAVEAGNFCEMLPARDFARPTPLPRGLAQENELGRNSSSYYKLV